MVVPHDLGFKLWFNDTFVSHHRNTCADPTDQRKLCWNQSDTQCPPSRRGKMIIPQRKFRAFGKIRAVRPTELETAENTSFSDLGSLSTFLHISFSFFWWSNKGIWIPHFIAISLGKLTISSGSGRSPHGLVARSFGKLGARVKATSSCSARPCGLCLGRAGRGVSSFSCEQKCGSSHLLQCEAPKIAKLVNITPITMVYGTQITTVTGPHCGQSLDFPFRKWLAPTEMMCKMSKI